GRFNTSGDAQCNAVLELEHCFARAVEAIGPQMRAARGVDQLRGDAHSAARLADRAFEHIADAQFAPDLLHIDGLALIGEARIARSEEHTSELQSPDQLVCRLLLEKK